MTPGSRIRRAALGLVALTVAAPAGCQSVPVAKFAPTPNRPQTTMAEVGRAALLPATVALETPAEMSAMEPVRYNQHTEPAKHLTGDPRPIVPRPTAPASPPPETPLLDEALARAKGMEAAIVEEMVATPAPTPAPIPPAQPETITPVPTPEPEPARAEKVEPKPEPTPAPAPSPAPTPAPAPISWEEVWRDGIQKLSGVAQTQTGQVTGSKIPWALRSRVLAWLAEPDIDPNLDQTESSEVRAVLRALADSPTAPTARAEDIEAAIQVLRDRAPLRIADLQLCLRVDGFGDFQAIEPPIRKVGQSLVIYCTMDNIRHEATGDGFRSRLAGQVELIPEGGTAPAWTESLDTAKDSCRYRRNDYFINYAFKVPKNLAAGRYTLRLTERDLVADRTATRDVILTVVRD